MTARRVFRSVDPGGVLPMGAPTAGAHPDAGSPTGHETPVPPRPQ